MSKKAETNCAMTIAGSDSGGGAGIQADMLSIAANGVYACTAIAAITAQNPDGVSAVLGVPPQTLRAQMETIESFYNPSAAKTGMLFDAKTILNSDDQRPCMDTILEWRRSKEPVPCGSVLILIPDEVELEYHVRCLAATKRCRI